MRADQTVQRNPCLAFYLHPLMEDSERIPFAPPRIDQMVIDEVVDTLRSGWITTGPKTKAFEKAITAYCGSQRTLCLSAWTTAAELFLRWWGIGEGDEVIIPSYTYCATANVVLHCGAKPVMVDVGPDYLMDMDSVERAITERTKIIMPVDVAGRPCDYEKLYELVMRTDITERFKAKNERQSMLGRILVMADAAHSFGASRDSKMVGKLADVTVFSFHAVKNLSTAEGGALTFRLPNAFHMESIYRELNTLSLHGQSKDALAKSQKGGWKYDVIAPGYKCNMTDIHASLGLVEISRYPENLAKRRSIYERYSEAFQANGYVQVPPGSSELISPSWHLYLLRLKDVSEEQRDAVMANIDSAGVSVNVHFQPLPLLSAYKELGFRIEDHPNAYELYSRTISLPIFYDMTDTQVERVIRTVKDAIAQELG